MKKNTKRSLFFSVMALILCCALLAGTTLAWFTDTASTAVNKIQAGTLDVALEMKDNGGNWVNAEGKTLQFKKAAGAPADEQVLWEPGCTYELPELRIVNKGNLNLKYKLIVNGIVGNTNAKLLEAIDFTYGTGININDEVILAPNATTEGIVIKGHMKEDAGNEYQGLSIDGIGITVIAAQQTGEYDSFGPDYDEGAEYNKFSATIMDNANGKTITLEKGKTYTVGNGEVVVGANGDVNYTNSGAAQTVTITTDGGTLTVDAPLDTVYHYGEANFVNITAVANQSFHEFGKVRVLAIRTGRVIAESGDNIDVVQVKSASAIVAVPENVVLKTTLQKSDNVNKFNLQKGNDTPIEVSVSGGTATTNKEVPAELEDVINKSVSETKDYVARIGNDLYATVQEAIMAAPASASAATVITILKDVTGGASFGFPDNTRDVGRNVTIDFAGHSYEFLTPGMGSTGTENQAMHLIYGNTMTLKNGTVSVSEDSTVIKRMIQNYCNLTLENMTVDCTNVASSYNNSICRGSLTVKGKTNLIASSDNAKIFDVDGAYCDDNNCNVSVVFDDTYTGTTSGVIEYVASENGHTSSLAIKAGTFTGSITSRGSTKPTITGGTFSSNPNAFCASGYGAMKEGGVYKVSSGKFAKTEEELESMLASGGTVYLVKDIALTSELTISSNVTLIGDGESVISALPVHVAPTANVTFKNVNFATPDNTKHNASSVYASGLEGKVEFDGCTFTNPQWECIQITPMDGAKVVVTNCTFIADGKGTYAQVNGTKVERLLHIQNTDATGKYTAVITGNKFIGVDLCRNAVIDVDDIEAFANVTCGENTFANHDNTTVSTMADGMIYVNINGDAENTATNTYAQFTQTPAAALQH